MRQSPLVASDIRLSADKPHRPSAVELRQTMIGDGRFLTSNALNLNAQIDRTDNGLSRLLQACAAAEGSKTPQKPLPVDKAKPSPDAMTRRGFLSLFRSGSQATRSESLENTALPDDMTLAEVEEEFQLTLVALRAAMQAQPPEIAEAADGMMLVDANTLSQMDEGTVLLSRRNLFALLGPSVMELARRLYLLDERRKALAARGPLIRAPRRKIERPVHPRVAQLRAYMRQHTLAIDDAPSATAQRCIDPLEADEILRQSASPNELRINARVRHSDRFQAVAEALHFYFLEGVQEPIPSRNALSRICHAVKEAGIDRSEIPAHYDNGYAGPLGLNFLLRQAARIMLKMTEPHLLHYVTGRQVIASRVVQIDTAMTSAGQLPFFHVVVPPFAQEAMVEYEAIFAPEVGGVLIFGRANEIPRDVLTRFKDHGMPTLAQIMADSPDTQSALLAHEIDHAEIHRLYPHLSWDDLNQTRQLVAPAGHLLDPEGVDLLGVAADEPLSFREMGEMSASGAGLVAAARGVHLGGYAQLAELFTIIGDEGNYRRMADYAMPFAGIDGKKARRFPLRALEGIELAAQEGTLSDQELATIGQGAQFFGRLVMERLDDADALRHDSLGPVS